MHKLHTDVDALRRGNLVKICGLKREEHALAAAESSADLVGLMFAESKRQVSVAQAAAIVQAVRSEFGPRSPLFVGVFVDPDLPSLHRIASEIDLDLVQIYGSRMVSRNRDFRYPVIRAVAPAPGSTLEAITTSLDAERYGANAPELFLIDAYDPVKHGGTGMRADWALAGTVARRFDLILAGGLTPENVAEAIEQVRPFGVDVSSGVETDGVKDPGKIRDFIANAKRTFEHLADYELDVDRHAVPGLAETT